MENDWKLEGKMNQGYYTFEYGFFGVFAVNFITSKTVCISFKVPTFHWEAHRASSRTSRTSAFPRKMIFGENARKLVRIE
jgi:hypothetical protein